MTSGISKKERDALKALLAGPVRRSAMPERVKAACDGDWLEAGFVVKQEVGYGKFLYCVRDSRLAKFMEVVDEVFPGYDDDALRLVDRIQATQVKSVAAPGRQRDGVVMLRDFSGVFGGHNHLDDLQSFRLSSLERAKLRTGLLVLTVQSMDSFLYAEPNKNGMPAFDVAIYISNDPPERLLQWISSLQYSSFTHYGDFDYQGMNIYQRLMNWCPKGACRLFRPKGLEAAFDRLNPSDKVAKKQSAGTKARSKKTDIPEIDEILEMIDAYGGVGVEQDVFDMEVGMELEIVE